MDRNVLPLPISRRNLIRELGIGAAALTIAPAASAQTHVFGHDMQPKHGGLEGLAQLRDHQTRRSSSFDTTGGNDDAVS